MKVSLKYAPVAENSPRFADDVVRVSAEIFGIRLDFSPQSLEAVDRIVSGMRRDGAPLEAVSATLFGFGMYVGEVFVRNSHARWVDLEEGPRRAFGHPLGIRMPDDRIWNPIGKVFEEFTDGGEGLLFAFYRGVTQGAAGSPG